MQVNSNKATLFVAIQPTQLIENHQEPNKVDQIIRQFVGLPKPKVKTKTSSVWQQHKVKILSAALVLTISSIVAAFMKRYDTTHWMHAYDGGKCPLPNPNDEFNHYICVEGKWNAELSVPPPGFCERAKACSLGEKITGCIDRKYFHNLSKECLKNPKGFACAERTSYEYPSKNCDRSMKMKTF